jgi:glycosyltransferase involved in cell wall biosynthesis
VTAKISSGSAAFPTARDPRCPFDPPAEYAELRAQEGTASLACPVGVDARVVSRYADVRAMLSNPLLSSHAAPSTHVVPNGVLDRPVAAGSLLTALRGGARVRAAVQELGIDILMPRSTLPALAVRRALRGQPRLPVVLDADGLPHDERVDFGGWSADGLAYRLLRDLEASAVRGADAVLTRSSKAVEILLARAGPGVDPARFTVVGNGRDENLFQPALAAEREAMRARLKISSMAPLLVYAGSLGAQYCLPEMLAFFRAVRQRRPDSRLLLLTGSTAEAEQLIAGQADLRQSCTVLRLLPGDVAQHLAACDLGLALRQPSFSMQAVAPIKLGEYLLCGLPVLASLGIGDSGALLEPGIGRALATMSEDQLQQAADWFVGEVLPKRAEFAARCRAAGLAHFGLAATVDAYARALAGVRG